MNSTAPASRPLRVAHVVDVLMLAGMEYGVVKLVNRLDRTRIESAIVCMRHQKEDVRPLLKPGTPVLELNRAPGRNWSVIGRMAARLREARVDIVHSHNWSTFLYTVAAARVAGVPVVIHGEHGKDDTLPNAKRLWACRILARATACVCAVSRDLADEVVRDWHVPPRKVAWIPNGVDLDPFDAPISLDAVRAEFGLDRGHRIVMNTGGFRAVKDHPTLLRAFARVHRDRPETRLILVGRGYDPDPNAGLEGMAADLHIADAVRFAGIRHDVPKLLRACDVYVNSSRYEGMSNTILEAMAAAKPVVATAVGGNPDLVQEGRTGFLVPSGDDASMAERVSRLLGDRELAERMGAEGRARIEAKHSMTVMVRTYTDLYERLWRESGRGGRA